MMKSDRHVYVMEENGRREPLGGKYEGQQSAAIRFSGFATNHPIPEQCDATKVLKALDKLLDAMGPIPPSDSALLPLSPFERGWVLGTLHEYQTWRAAGGRHG